MHALSKAHLTLIFLPPSPLPSSLLSDSPSGFEICLPLSSSASDLSPSHPLVTDFSKPPAYLPSPRHPLSWQFPCSATSQKPGCYYGLVSGWYQPGEETFLSSVKCYFIYCTQGSNPYSDGSPLSHAWCFCGQEHMVALQVLQTSTLPLCC